MKVYNGEGMILGRLAAHVAKDALLQEEVYVVNCSRVIISGEKVNTVQRETQRRLRKGYPLKSAKFSKLPERMVRRAIRGMLPWKTTRGREAFKRIMCFRELPEGLAKESLIILKDSHQEKLPTLNYITIGELSQRLGGKA